MVKEEESLMKKIKSLLFLIALFIILIVLLIFQKKAPSSSDETPSSATAVVSLLKKDVKSMELSKEGASLIYLPTEESWTFSEAEKYPLDEALLNRSCNSLLKISASKRFQSEELENFGLKSPSQSITYILNNGEKIHLNLGDLTSDGNSIYGQKSGDDGIYLLPSTLASYIVSDKTSFRLKELASIDYQTLTHFIASGKDLETFDIKAETDSNAFISSYIAETPRGPIRVDSTAFTRLLQKLPTSLQVSQFVADNVTDLTPYGLAEPRLRLFIENAIPATEAGASTQNQLTPEPTLTTLDYLWGNETENGEIYFMEKGGSSVYTMASHEITSFIQDLNFFQLISKQPAFVNLDLITDVTLNFGTENYKLSLSEEPKTSSAEKEEPQVIYTINEKSVEEKTFKEIYRNLISLSAPTLLEGPQATDSPELQIIFTLKDGTTKEVTFYSYNPHYYSCNLYDTFWGGCDIKTITYLQELLKKALA